MAVAIVVLLSASGVIPTALAVHGFPVSALPGTTLSLEDDGAIVNAPGHILHGRENRVVPPGSQVGDGSLYLDVRLQDAPGATAATVEFPASLIVGSFIGRPDVIASGYHRAWAWYGWWHDLNNDGVIADIHDAECVPRCQSGATDEFKWRGIATDESLTVTLSYIPTTTPTTGAAPDYNGHTWTRMEDLTAQAHQTWVAPARAAYLEAFITRLTVIGYGNTVDVLNGPGGFPLDLADPNALQDVDIHDALSPDVEALYWSVTRSAADARATAGDPVGLLPFNPYPVRPPPVDTPPTSDLPGPSASALLARVVQIAVDAEDGKTPDVGYPQRPPKIDPVPLPDLPGPTPTSILALVVGNAARTSQFLQDDPAEAVAELQRTANRWLQPAWPKEPNTWDDDYGSHAVFSGVGDALGSYNSYLGYADSRHLWIDNLALASACFGPRGGVSTNVQGQSTSGACIHTITNEPVGGLLIEKRSSGVSLTVKMYVGLWHDINVDTHVGNFCDPSTSEFDSERNTCVKVAYTSWPHTWGAPEIIPACVGSSARNGLVHLTPIGGNWPRAIVIRDADDLTQSVTGQPIEVRDDVSMISLNFADQCNLDGTKDVGIIQSRDVVYFPEGPKVAIRMEVEVISAPYLDLATGVILPSERVVDVDILPAAL